MQPAETEGTHRTFSYRIFELIDLLGWLTFNQRGGKIHHLATEN